MNQRDRETLPCTFLQLGYSLGLINVVNTSDSPGISAKSRGIQISAGVTIPL